eukprot:scaffold529_cov308-Pinguiococcus_pyrenoidosus.AAC.70
MHVQAHWLPKDARLGVGERRRVALERLVVRALEEVREAEGVPNLAAHHQLEIVRLRGIAAHADAQAAALPDSHVQRHLLRPLSGVHEDVDALEGSRRPQILHRPLQSVVQGAERPTLPGRSQLLVDHGLSGLVEAGHAHLADRHRSAGDAGHFRERGRDVRGRDGGVAAQATPQRERSPGWVLREGGYPCFRSVLPLSRLFGTGNLVSPKAQLNTCSENPKYI